MNLASCVLMDYLLVNLASCVLMSYLLVNLASCVLMGYLLVNDWRRSLDCDWRLNNHWGWGSLDGVDNLWTFHHNRSMVDLLYHRWWSLDGDGSLVDDL